MPEHEPPTDVTLHELMTGDAHEDYPTMVTATSSTELDAESTISKPIVSDASDDDAMLDDYLEQPQRRLGRLTIVLLVALIFMIGFIAGVVVTGIVT